MVVIPRCPARPASASVPGMIRFTADSAGTAIPVVMLPASFACAGRFIPNMLFRIFHSASFALAPNAIPIVFLVPYFSAQGAFTPIPIMKQILRGTKEFRFSRNDHKKKKEKRKYKKNIRQEGAHEMGSALRYGKKTDQRVHSYPSENKKSRGR
ncbi:MAG: hypothetical protein IJQ62_03160 [Clostridia bacterium]|nr:hypothetical protein [Clostridia bacterium]